MRVALPRQICGRLAARVCDLDSCHRPVCFQKTIDARQRFDVFLRPQTGATGRDPTFGRDRRGLRDDQTRAADRPRAEVNQMPVGRDAISRRILAHRRDADAIAQRDGLDRQRLK